MQIKSALKHRDRAIERVRDLYSSAEQFGLPSDTINERYCDILQSELPAGKAPGWTRSFVDGYRKALIDNLYRSSLVYGAFIDGKFYSTHRNRDDYYEKQGLSARIFAEEHDKAVAGHYWASNLKPFFIGTR